MSVSYLGPRKYLIEGDVEGTGRVRCSLASSCGRNLRGHMAGFCGQRIAAGS